MLPKSLAHTKHSPVLHFANGIDTGPIAARHGAGSTRRMEHETNKRRFQAVWRLPVREAGAKPHLGRVSALGASDSAANGQARAARRSSRSSGVRRSLRYERALAAQDTTGDPE
ncbi:hypothetical protein RDV84_06305 [Lysobacter yananisis]|uniref:Uncharacterized protein n=1 Tax=Lysobacter yananisis TaxID=1003114 RepID=A0ABY9PF31_9GAMM|nr:hypothetical protein [Lysobacter yananisis]WMT04437.1 hypothetical protein RDV84_06305 [Lysobacter yananisis]